MYVLWFKCFIPRLKNIWYFKWFSNVLQMLFRNAFQLVFSCFSTFQLLFSCFSDVYQCSSVIARMRKHLKSKSNNLKTSWKSFGLFESISKHLQIICKAFVKQLKSIWNNLKNSWKPAEKHLDYLKAFQSINRSSEKHL